MSTKIIYGFDDLGNKVPIGSYSVRQYVGGIIININSSADGTYTFYNAQGTQVSAPSLDTDCTGWTYTVTGATRPKYMVYSGSLISNKWGYNGVTITVANTFYGKVNTDAILALTPQDSDCIWSDLRTMRTNQINGCDDWYIGCGEDYEGARDTSSTLMTIRNNNPRIWTSKVYDTETTTAMYMFNDGGPGAYNMPGSANRTVVYPAIPIRTF